MSSLQRYIFRRILQAIPLCLGIIVVCFVLLKLTPGDLVDVMAGESGGATEEYIAELRAAYGLDVPVWEQFRSYVWNALHFDFGYSFRQSAPVLDLILDRVPATLFLSMTALIIALVGGVTLGAIAARKRGSWIDEAISVFSTIGFAIPLFWVGLMFIVIFSIRLRWLPSSGMVTVGADHAGWLATAADIGSHMVLPALTLSLFYLSIYVRLTRSAVLEVQELDFVRTARAKGLSEARITLRHVLRNALLPIVTITGLQLGSVFSGTIVIETVFGWPGIGRLANDAVASRDLQLLLGVFLFSTLMVVLINLAVDLIYVILDPRVERS
ncbi:ABC transporter permease [Sinirhodobacter populi]|uniref:ABC transporter permease n=1 Tax=Paenirhodobacter populi TaxID=2306993 RepID=A0A443K4K2_9RHOB|nr:ABC transporter permease [Sinirhodobacter populi]RWR27699.1 ABC transporter permease [Sinirhodobacter populi]